MEKVLGFEHWLKAGYVAACVAHKQPKPDDHERYVVKQSFFKQRIAQIGKQKREKAGIDVVAEGVFLQKQVLGGVLGKAEAKGSEQHKADYSR